MCTPFSALLSSILNSPHFLKEQIDGVRVKKIKENWKILNLKVVDN